MNDLSKFYLSKSEAIQLVKISPLNFCAIQYELHAIINTLHVYIVHR